MTKPAPLPTHYDAALSEAKHSSAWDQAGYAKGDPKRPGKPYSIILPPPNVTGSLHMGHALNNVLQDALIRYRRMDGDNVVWIPGFDHASIAVHWVLERQLRSEGTSRQALGREAFLRRAWAFKEESQSAILRQQKRLGISCDYSRTAFTLDEPRSQAVKKAFVQLHRDGLIYRDNRLVNWDPISQTSVSDLEVVHEDNVKTELYAFAYPLSDGSGELVVATTRPETMLGDTAIAVHPDDPRYKHLIGKTVDHPLVDRRIAIIGDAILVDPKFGTGAVKITPAHDFNDFAVGQRHNLASINLLNKDGTFNEHAQEFAGLSVPQARSAVKERLQQLGLFRGSEEHTMSIGRSERSGAILEPMLSLQWYVRARPLAAPALAAIRQKFARFVPEGWENTYFSWLDDIRDWCISRQLWWGHQIPAYDCLGCGRLHVDETMPEACLGCGHKELRQDDDVLDTWFSSALWPFSTQGWPQASEDLARWYPTQVVVTSFDIIFFWVARMMMFGLYFTGSVPFKDIYIHALIRDAKGEKMSKTKGNVVDPLEMIELYGCDAFRFTLLALAGQGRDVRWDESRAQGYQKFLNKVWQAYRFMSAQLQDGMRVPKLEEVSLGVFDRWILGRLQEAIGRVRQGLDQYRFNDAAAALYSFVWDELCDWYLEVSKTTLYGEAADGIAKDAVRRVLLEAFSAVARLMHPMCPFLAEELFGRLKTQDPKHPVHGASATPSVMVAPYPKVADYVIDADALAEANFVQGTITAVRRLRAEFNVPIKQEVTVLAMGTPLQQKQLGAQAQVFKALCRAELQLHDNGPLPAQAAVDVFSGCTLCMPLAGVIDVAAELTRLHKELKKIDADRGRIDAQLGRADFLSRAPKEVVADKHAQLQALAGRRQRLSDAAVRLQAD